MTIDWSFVALVAAAVALCVGAHALRRQPRRLWAASWATMIVASAVVEGDGIGRPEVFFLVSMFATAQLAAALAFALGRTPAWIVPASLGLGLCCIGVAGMDADLRALPVAASSAGLLAASGVLARAASRSGVTLRLGILASLPLGMLAALLLLLPALVDGSEPSSFARVAWVALLIGGSPFQLRAEDERDIAAREAQGRRTLDELESVRERFRALTESSFDLIAELDHKGVFNYVNPRYEQLLGYRADSLVGRLYEAILHPEDAERATQFERLKGDGGRPDAHLVRVRHQRGHYLWLETVISSFLTAADETRWVASSRDATERRAREETGARVRERLEERVTEQTAALQESEARFRALADHAPELISEFDERGRYTFANESFRELLGLDPATLLGGTARDLLHPDDLAASNRGMRRALADEGTTTSLHRLRHADGSWRWFDNTGRAYRTPDGELRFVSIGRDVTSARRLEEERRRLEERLRESERLESMRVLAGGVAHDFNNLLSVILGNVTILEQEEASAASHQLRRIRAAARHAEALTRQLVAYVGRSVREVRPLDLSDLVRETEPLLRASLSSSCHLVLQLEDGLPRVEGDPTELRQVLLNLVSNAADALDRPDDTIQVRTRMLDGGAATDAHGFGEGLPVDDAPWVALEVVDEGSGMDESTRARILEPFYTTKAPGRGLGLAVVLGVATAHRGRLAVESEPGLGSTFRLLLPPSSRGPAERSKPRAEPAHAAHAGDAPDRVLVIDDDDAVLELDQLFLERAGFQVESACGGHQALVRLGHPPQPDCVVLDLAMPDLPGTQLLASLRSAWPDIPVIVVTGFLGAAAEARLGKEKVWAVLEKPCEPDRLIDAVRDAIAGASREPADRRVRL